MGRRIGPLDRLIVRFAKEVASQVCFLDAGSILERGTAEQIFEDPHEERTQQFLSRVVKSGRL